MKKSKYLHLFIFVLFIYFSYVQLNDVDSWIWIGIYSSISILAFLKIIGSKISWPSKFIVLCISIFIILNHSLLTSWLEAGKPAFIDYEPTNIQEVENIREFLGLLIAFFTALLYMTIFNKK